MFLSVASRPALVRPDAAGGLAKEARRVLLGFEGFRSVWASSSPSTRWPWSPEGPAGGVGTRSRAECQRPRQEAEGLQGPVKSRLRVTDVLC